MLRKLNFPKVGERFPMLRFGVYASRWPLNDDQPSENGCQMRQPFFFV